MKTLTVSETPVRTTVRTTRKTSAKKVINGPALYFLSKSPSSRAKGLFSELILKRWRWSCWRGRWRCTGTQWREGSPGVHRSSCGLLSLPRPLLPSGNPPLHSWNRWRSLVQVALYRSLLRHTETIPHICYFLYTGKIFQAKILHPKARKLRQIEFRDKIS